MSEKYKWIRNGEILISTPLLELVSANLATKKKGYHVTIIRKTQAPHWIKVRPELKI
jgi:hypothetical protein